MSNKLSFFLISLFVLVMGISCSQADYTERIEEHKILAGELLDNGLYQNAVEEYEKIFDYPGVSKEIRGNIYYLMGKIYEEKLSDYTNALSSYIKARELNPDGSFIEEANRRIVKAFEKTGDIVSARNELHTQVDIDAGPRDNRDLPVAKINDRTIWLSEIEDQIRSLPLEAQLQFASAAGKKIFIDRFIGMELIHRAALREGLDYNPEIVKQKNEMFRQLLIDKYVSTKVLQKVAIDSLDLKNYYTVNKTSRYNNADYDKVKNRVFTDYQNEKAEQMINDHVNKLSQSENVQILEQNIR